MRHLITPLLALLVSFVPVSGKEKAPAREKIPGGFLPLEQLADAKAKAVAEHKLVVLVVKGRDDACPNCAMAFKNGMSAVGSDVVKIFTRDDIIRSANSSEFPSALKARCQQQFTGGAWVTVVVFDPAMEKLIAQASRKELQDNKDAIAAFKKTVQTAKKELKAAK